AHVGTSVELGDLISEHVQDLYQRLMTRGVQLEVKQIPAIGGVNVFAAYLDDTEAGNPLRLCGGQSAHVDPLLPSEHGILEAVQTRAVMISGGREDLERHDGVATLSYDVARREGSW